MKKQTHKQFSKPFWKLLGSSVLGFFFLYGGIVWASYTWQIGTGTTQEQNCELEDSYGTPIGTVCEKLDKSGDSGDEIDIEIDANLATHNVFNKGADYTYTYFRQGYSNTDTTITSPTLRVKNTGSDDIFIPYQTKTELDSFLAARETAITADTNASATNASATGYNPKLRDIDICEPGELNTVRVI